MNAPKETSYFCPQCQSPLVTISALAGGDASCEACGWKGKDRDLLGYNFETGFSSPEEVLQAFARDVKLLLARDGVGLKIGQLIVKWGLVDTIDVPTLSRYVGAVAKGIATAVLELRSQIEKEKHNVS